MTRTSLRKGIFGLGLLAILGMSLGVSAEPPKDDSQTEKPEAAALDSSRVPLAVARDRARLLHASYAATLDVMHRHYFRSDHAVLPARAMEDVFARMAQESKVKARWIAVNTTAMSVQHEPKSEFEKQAAAVLAEGKPEFEQVENGYYRRAGAIPLGTGCVHCHTKLFGGTPNAPRFAGLVISVPVSEK